MKKDFYRRCRRAIRKADRFRMKGIAREAILNVARRKVAKALAAVLVAMLITTATGCAHLPLAAAKKPADDTNERVSKVLVDGSLAVSTRLGLAHGCAIELTTSLVDALRSPQVGLPKEIAARLAAGQTAILTNGHVVDPRPLDTNAPALPVCWSDERGNEGLASPIWIDRYRDLAILEVRRGLPGTVFPLATERPATGAPTWTLGYDFSSRSRALAPRVVHADIVRTVAGLVVLDRSADEGSSGGCVLDADGHALALSSWAIGVGYKDGERVSAAVGLWGDWLGPGEEK